MPPPSSLTRISDTPPAAVTTSMRRRAGVEGVLDQFLDDARRPLDHFAGGDAVDHVLAEAADRHGGEFGGFGEAGEVRYRPTARQPMSRRQKPPGQSMAATAS